MVDRINPSWTYNKRTTDLNELLKFCDKKVCVSIDWILKNVKTVSVDDEERINQSNLKCPIVLLKTNKKLFLLDGSHRLAKAKKENVKEILAYFISIESLPSDIKEIFL